MDEATLTRIRWYAETRVCETLAARGEFFVPVSSSNRHVHLSKADMEALFGAGYVLNLLRELRQPGQYACKEQVTIAGPKGELVLRVVGPLRAETQVELSVSDCMKLGIPPVVRMSGEAMGTPGATLKTKCGSVVLPRGVMVAARHLHLSAEQGKLYGLKSNDRVKLIVEGERPAVFENLIVRCGAGHILEAHIDTEEANACLLPTNAVCRIQSCSNGGTVTIKQGGSFMQTGNEPKRYHGNVLPAETAPVWSLSGQMNEHTTRGAMPEPTKRGLLTEAEVIEAYRRGEKSIMAAGLVVTPLAKDKAKQLGIELCR